MYSDNIYGGTISGFKEELNYMKKNALKVLKVLKFTAKFILLGCLVLKMEEYGFGMQHADGMANSVQSSSKREYNSKIIFLIS